ncbi:MAG: hypothetical protein HYY06_02785 [Deltaproteobacteria bacterium]|nr:hypothetical protein [Deltaproteobacteria bacterium]
MTDETGRLPPPLRRKLSYWAILFLVAAGLCELASLAVYRWAAGEGFSFSAVDAHRSRILQEVDEVEPAPGVTGDETLTAQVIHPYLGYVVDPARARRRVHAQGFPRIDAAFAAPRETIVVGVFGGSVAEQLVDRASPTLAEGLSRAPAFAGRRISIVSGALPGYKQPQQALALAYLQMLGARFDVVINLDGFNEITLPVVENLPRGVFFAYPPGWYLRTVGLHETQVVREIGTIATMRSTRRDLARFARESFLRHLVTPNVLWFLIDRRISASVGRHQRLLGTARTGRFLQAGPRDQRPPTSDEVFRRSAELWVRGSQSMEALARARGAPYFHFLQPNQYVEGSKPLSDEERHRAYDMGDASYGPPARRGYPLLIVEGRKLAASGFPFEDLTGIFAEETRTMYSDTCCHLNQAGCDILAQRIAATIVHGLARSAGPQP